MKVRFAPLERYSIPLSNIPQGEVFTTRIADEDGGMYLRTRDGAVVLFNGQQLSETDFTGELARIIRGTFVEGE